MATIVPYEVAYPVNFQSGGDVTKEAFGKHIQEIERIYGIINGLNASKVSADEFKSKLQSHIDDSNPHPNLNLSNTQGTLPSSRITGNFDFSRITGSLPASRITGSFDTSMIEGLTDVIKQNAPSEVRYMYSITGGGHCIVLKDTIAIQCGKKTVQRSEHDEASKTYNVNFPTPFSSDSNYFVVVSLKINGLNYQKSADVVAQVIGKKANYFTFILQEFYESTNDWTSVDCEYIAMGVLSGG